MHVLQMPSWYPDDAAPLDGSFFAEQFQMLADSGMQVGVLTLRPVRAELVFSTRSVISEVRDGLPVFRVRIPAMPVVLGRLEEIILRTRVIRAARIYESRHGIPDVIHAHSAFPGMVGARYLSEFWQRPFVVTEHRPSTILDGHRGHRANEIRGAVAAASARATVSTRFAQELGKYYGRDDWRAIELPTPAEFFESELYVPGADLPFTFIHVSHLGENKRADQLCRVFNDTFDGDASVRLEILGGVPSEIEEVKTLSGISSWPQNIEFLGVQSREQVSLAMARADCFVLTSASEAGGTVFSEAQAAGTPIIASDTWAGDFAVREGIGIKVAIDDDDALAEAFRTARTSGTFVSPAEIRLRAEQRYSPQKFVERTAAMYAEVRPSKGRSSMIFHTPMTLDQRGASASKIRPVRMLEAFKEDGYEVFEISGPAKTRRQQIKRLKRRMRNGLRPEFLYSELSSMPMAMTEPLRKGIHPFLDFSFFRFCRAHGVPVGAFYRDIYWRFNSSESKTAYHRLADPFFRLDEFLFPHCLNVLFLPSLRMGEYIRFPRNAMVALPPGADIVSTAHSLEVKLLYVGALGGFYRLQRLVEAVREVPEVQLTLCVPPAQWASAHAEYDVAGAENISIVHGSGAELEPLYADATIGVLSVEPIEYRTFAAPFKLYEYLGQGLPVLASSGTHAGDVVADAQAGWTVDYTTEAIAQALRELVQHPELIEEARSRAVSVSARNTWIARVEQVAEVLQR